MITLYHLAFIQLLLLLSISIQYDPMPDQPKIISAKMNLNMAIFVMQCTVGDPPIVWTRPINQASDITWISNVVYRIINSKTVTNLTEDPRTKQSLHYDSISFNDHNTILYNDFYYYYVINSKEKRPSMGWLGMSFKFHNDNFSIVHQLQKRNQINHLSYAFSIEEKLMYFGGIPSDVIKDKTKGVCNVNPSNANWSCTLNKVSVGSLTFVNMFESYFQTSEEMIMAPREFMVEYANAVIAKFISSSECSVGDLDKNIYINCLTEIIPSLPSIAFTFDNYTYTLTSKEQFMSYGILSRWNIQLNNSTMTWIFGTAFLRHFDSLFDYEEKTVSLYSKDKITLEKNKKNSFNYIKVLALICLCCILIWSSYLLYLKYCYLNKELLN